MIDVAIIGAGIAGLSAAYELTRRGASIVLLERAPRVGGVILSEEIDGFTIDAGPDSLIVQKPAGIKLCEELGLGDRLVSTLPPRIAYIQRHGRLHRLPEASVLGVPTRIAPFVRTGLFSWSGKMRMAAELFVPRRTDDSDESIGAFMTRRFGAEATTYLAEPLLAGIHAGDVDRLSLRALFPRFIDAERTHGSLIRAFRAAARAHGARAGAADGVFRSLPGGLSELVQALTKAIGSERIRTATSVEAIAGSGPFDVRGANGVAISARSLIVATPAYATAALLRPQDADLAAQCAAIPYASVATVALAFDRSQVAHPLHGSGFVVPRTEANGILAASWLSSKWPHRAPAGRVLMRTFLGGARDPKVLERDDRDLIKVSLDAVRPVLGISGEPRLVRVYRWDRANAQHETGHLDRMAAIDAALVRHPGLFITGSGFRGVGIPDCVADGRATAARALDWLKRSNAEAAVEATRT